MCHQTYDIVFSLGEACLCSQALRKARLQFASYPLDWVAGRDFLGRIELITSEFERYFDKEDLVPTGHTNNATHNPCDVYNNTYNKMVFNHDFPVGANFDEVYPSVKAKYDRRIARLLDGIKTAKRVLVVYIETTDPAHKKFSDEDILQGYKSLKAKFSAYQVEIDLLYMANNEQEEIFKYINENVMRAETSYSSRRPAAPFYMKALKKVLHRFRVKRSIMKRLKDVFLKIAVNLVASKKLRQKLKHRFHIH